MDNGSDHWRNSGTLQRGNALSAQIFSVSRKFQAVALSAIDWADRVFEFDAHGSADCDARAALVKPLTLRERGDSFQIVCGHRCADAARADGWSELECLVLDESTCDLDCLRLALMDAAMDHALDPIERALFLQSAQSMTEDKAILAEVCRQLGIDANARMMNRMLAFLKIEPELRSLLSNRQLSEKIVERLSRFKVEEQRSIAELIEKCKPGANLQREWIENLEDISTRDEQSINDILCAARIRGIIDDPDKLPNLKASEFRGIIHHLRFPILSEWEDEFRQGLKELNWPKYIRLQHSPFFERSKLKIEIEFETKDEVKEAARILNEAFVNESVCEKLKVRS